MKRSSSLAALVLVVGCGGGDDAPLDPDGPAPDDSQNPDGPAPDGPAGTFAITSTAFTEGQTIPMEHTCNGNNTSPQLAWTNKPVGTQSFAMVLIDKSFNDFVHSVIYDIPADRADLPADIDKVFSPPDVPGAHQTRSFNNGPVGYRGPCPPSLHTYEFGLYAIDIATLPGLSATSSADAGLAAILMHDIAKTTITGTYDQP